MAYQTRFHADKFRDKSSAAEAFRISAIFAHFAKEWAGLVSKASWSKILMRYKRGELDDELQEKVTLEKMDLAAKSFRFLQTYDVELPDSVVLDKNDSDEKAAKLQANVQMALFEENKLLLAREQSRFDAHMTDLEKFMCTNESARAAYKAAESSRNAELLKNHLAKNFPLRDVEDEKFVVPYVMNCSRAWVETANVEVKEVYYIWWINLLIPGSKALPCARTALSKVCDAMAGAPERSCAILFAPNTSNYGETYSQAATDRLVVELEALLGDADNRVLVKKLTLAFDEESIPAQSTRAFSHVGFMLISDAHVAGNPEKSVCEFVGSRLWVRGGISQLPLLPVKKYCNPVAKVIKAGFDPTKDLSKSLRMKQHMSGHELQSMIVQRLWQGLKVTSAARACLTDMFPYDGSLAEAVMRMPAKTNAAKVPTMCVISPVWAKTDMEPIANANICAFLERMNTNVFDALLNENLVHLEGWKNAEMPPDVGPAPILVASDFKATIPTASGALAPRQDWLDSLCAKLGHPASEAWSSLMKLIAQHNAHYNKSGRAYSDKARGQKRAAAEVDGNLKDAKIIRVEEGGPNTKDELLSQFDSVAFTSVPCQGQEMLVGSDGSCWLHGLQDGVVLASLPLCQIYGRFVVGTEAEESLNKGGSLKYAMASASHLVGAEVDQSEAPKPIEAFTKSLSTIQEFIKHLANAGLHNVSIECHDATLKFESGSVDGGEQQGVVGCHLEITPKTTCCYVVSPCPANVADGFPNVGSKLLADESKWNFATRQNNCGHLVVHDQVQYISKKEHKGIIPLKPQIYLSNPVRISKGDVRKLH